MEFQYIPPGANAPIATSSVYPPPEQPATQSTVTGLDAARQVDPVGNIIPQETSSLPNAPDATWSMPAAPPLENQNLQTQYGGLDGSSQVVNAPQDAVSPVSQEPERRVSVPRTESSPSAPTTHPEDNANNNSIDEDDGSEMDHIFSPLQNLSTQREDPSQSTSPSQQVSLHCCRAIVLNTILRLTESQRLSLMSAFAVHLPKCNFPKWSKCSYAALGFGTCCTLGNKRAGRRPIW